MGSLGERVARRSSALFAALATVCLLVGFCTPWWLQAPSLHLKAGLWTTCAGSHCTSLLDDNIGGWLKACQGLAIAALLTSVLTSAVAFVMVTASRDSTLTTAKYGVIATSLVTGVTLAVCVAVYHFRHHLIYPDSIYSPSISFFLVLVSAGLFLAVGLLLLIFSLTVNCRHALKSQAS